MTTRITTAVANTLADAVVDQLDAGTVKIYSGSQPATANTAASGTLLATITLANPAFGSAAAGVATATDPAAVTAVANGTAGWFRAATSGGTTVHDGAVTVTGGGGELTLASLAITTGLSVDVTSYTWTQPTT